MQNTSPLFNNPLSPHPTIKMPRMKIFKTSFRKLLILSKFWKWRIWQGVGWGSSCLRHYDALRTKIDIWFAPNPFVPNSPFLYPLKTLEKLYGFLMFSGVEKGCIGNKWANNSTVLPFLISETKSRKHFCKCQKTGERLKWTFVLKVVYVLKYSLLLPNVNQ